MNDEKQIEVWVTKWALTKGVIHCVARIPAEHPDMAEYTRYNYVHKPHWHTTEAEALAHVEVMRLAKVKSLKKQLAKLETLKPKWVEE